MKFEGMSPPEDKGRSLPELAADTRLPSPHDRVKDFGHRFSQKSQFLFVILTAVILASGASQFVAKWIGLPKTSWTFRRIGPQNGPQVFCAGSSLLQFGLSWPEITQTFGQGIENWGTAGSTPDLWEISQALATNTDLMIIGVDLYDLNEEHLCDSRANILPLSQTIKDLWQSHSGWQFSKRVLSQYPLAWVRIFFPTAGRSDNVLVGVREKIRGLLHLSSYEDRARGLVLPSQPVLDFGEYTESVSDWSEARLLRRVASARSENHGQHRFDGLKKLSFLRMLHRAEQNGRIIVVVLPVSPAYTHAFVNPDVSRRFEEILADARQAAPQAQFMRLDDLPSLNSDKYFSDLVHLNGGGRRIATAEFLKNLNKDSHLP